MTKENTEIFLPFSYEEYKRNKITLLQTNLKTVQTIDRLNRIHELRRIKNEQHRLLKEAVKEFKKQYTKLKSNLPSGKEIKLANINERSKDPVKVTKLYNPKSPELDSELARIKDKIRSLNF